MKLRTVGVVIPELLVAYAVAAQIKIVGKQHCPKPRALATTEVGDGAGQTMTFEKSTCAWLTPLEIVGAKSKEGTFVAFFETSQTRAATNGTYVGTMDSGDGFYIAFHWETSKDGHPECVKGDWVFTGGTGKLKGISGTGSYRDGEREWRGGQHRRGILGTRDGRLRKMTFVNPCRGILTAIEMFRQLRFFAIRTHEPFKMSA